MGIDLQAWRRKEGLTYQQLGKLLDVKAVTSVRRYCVGESVLQGELLQRVLVLTKEEVDLYEMHKCRLRYLRSQNKINSTPFSTLPENKNIPDEECLGSFPNGF